MTNREFTAGGSVEMFLFYLKRILSITSQYKDIEDLKISEDLETVEAVFPSGTIKINIACDSPTAAVRDILRRIAND